MARQSESRVETWGYSNPTNAVPFDPRNPQASYTSTWYTPYKPSQPTTTQTPKTINQSGDWVTPTAPSKSTATPILDAINRKIGGNTVPQNSWPNTAPVTPTPVAPLSSNTSGGPVPSSAPSPTPAPMTPLPARPLPMQWRPVEPIRGNILNPIQAPQIGTPIVDIAPAPTPQPTTPAQTKVGGPSGFTEQFTAPTTAMPSVDQLYKIYTDMAGENRGMREYLASPQFQGLWQSGNIPYWMLSDPVWRSYLQKIGLLSWDALARRMGQQ